MQRPARGPEDRLRLHEQGTLRKSDGLWLDLFIHETLEDNFLILSKNIMILIMIVKRLGLGLGMGLGIENRESKQSQC